MYEFLLAFLISFWTLTAEMAPWLLLGFAAAGILHVFIPIGLITRHIGGESPAAVVKASLLGIPLPLCSCGVLPVAASLRKSGAGRAPTLSFLISTPVTGVDSLAATWSLLGWFFMLARLIVSVVIGLASGFVMSLTGRNIPEDTAPAETPISCADDGNNGLQHKKSFMAGLKSALSYAFLELPETIASSILTGLVLGGLITALLPPDLIQNYIGGGFRAVLAATVIGIPLYVCATGSIPIAAAMIMQGFTPGAALAFMIAGPASNMAAVSTVHKLLGKRALAVYLASIFSGALASGLLLDRLFPQARAWLPDFTTHHHQHGLSLFDHLTAAAFMLLTLSLLVRRRLSSAAFTLKTAKGSNDMSEILFSVPGMSCNHCKMSVTRALSAIEGVTAVEVDLVTKKVAVSCTGEPDEKKMLAALENAGFEAGVLKRG